MRSDWRARLYTNSVLPTALALFELEFMILSGHKDDSARCISAIGEW